MSSETIFNDYYKFKNMYEEQLNKQLLRNFCKDSAEHFFFKGWIAVFC